MRRKLLSHARGWSTRRRITVYLFAQSLLLGVTVTVVRAWDAHVSPLGYLVPWLGAAAGGLMGLVHSSRKA
ncbi:hypothetical protein ABT026_11490 [Streptomyces sp. NPDC002734]|uniref:hypothetical protein n=1 Tax=Streptomyces sp. NPDC002734 TaxID=3154426 RepID=UPI00332CF206